MHAYKNSNTDEIVVFPEPNARLEMLNEWSVVTDHSQIPVSAAAAHDRASAESASIQSAAAIRLDSVAGAAIRQVAAATATQTAAGTVQPYPALSVLAGAPEQATSLVPLLDKNDPARRAVTTSRDLVDEQARHEEQHPPKSGVLSRAKADQKEGRTQPGPHAERHAGPKAAAIREAAGAPSAAGGEQLPRPADDAAKPEWIAYAVRMKSADEATAKGLTTKQLVEQYG